MKENRGAGASVISKLFSDDLLCLQSAVCFDQFELNFSAIVNGLESIHDQLGVMEEDVLITFNGDEAVAFFLTEHLYFSQHTVRDLAFLLSQLNYSLFQKLCKWRPRCQKSAAKS